MCAGGRGRVASRLRVVVMRGLPWLSATSLCLQTSLVTTVLFVWFRAVCLFMSVLCSNRSADVAFPQAEQRHLAISYGRRCRRFPNPILPV